jgi:hypothetical protein
LQAGRINAFLIDFLNTRSKIAYLEGVPDSFAQERLIEQGYGTQKTDPSFGNADTELIKRLCDRLSITGETKIRPLITRISDNKKVDDNKVDGNKASEFGNIFSIYLYFC